MRPEKFNQLNPAEKLTVICTVKSKTDTELAVAKAEISARQTALDVTAAAVLNPLKEKSRALKVQAVEILNEHRKLIMDGAKTLEVAGQAIGYRWSTAVETDEEEAEIVRALDSMAADASCREEDRMSAEACLKRPLPTLDKNFILKVAKTSAAWLRSFSIRVTRNENLSIKHTNTAEES